MKKLLLALVCATLITLALSLLILPRFDAYQADGKAVVTALTAPVTIVRDDKGMPYIYADNLEDVLLGQGFATAQDRLAQMELWRRIAQGRLSETIGEAGLAMDRMIHLVDVPGLAERQAALLAPEEQNYYRSYAEGINAFVQQRPGDLPLALRAMGITPVPWTLEDIIAVQFFRVWSSSTNWREELLSQQLIDRLGPERAAQLAQLSVNPDAGEAGYQSGDYLTGALALRFDDGDLPPASLPHANGSNSWASGSRRSANGKPILAGDPHVDARKLPGFWHPVGLITPKLRAVGGGTPGVPGLGLGRTADIAWGATNGYGDVVDLYIEQVDPANPDHYLEGERSIPFAWRKVVLQIKDADAAGGLRSETLRIRSTRRGPIISDHGFELADGKLISLRWAVAEFLGERMGMRGLLLARNTGEALRAIDDLAVPLTYIVADQQGEIARRGAGFIPLRVRGDGAIPQHITDSEDHWAGRIPPSAMPLLQNPEEDWVGSANQRIVADDYPYAYSSHFSHSWRYRRLQELMAGEDILEVSDHWRFMLDVKNMLAQRIAPVMAATLRLSPDTRLQTLGELLTDWDYMDDVQAPAPLVFQTLLRHFATQTVVDELGDELSSQYLQDYYYWHERLARIIMEPDNSWFDDIRTEQTETRDDILLRAGSEAWAELARLYGDSPGQWQWGDAHTIVFSHQVLPGERAANWLGGGTHPMAGSGETLNRAMYPFDRPYDTNFIASMRWVADLSDPDKIQAHIPGGNSERLFSPHAKDQLADWIDGSPRYWWFSDRAIEEHAVSHFLLEPSP